MVIIDGRRPTNWRSLRNAQVSISTFGSSFFTGPSSCRRMWEAHRELRLCALEPIPVPRRAQSLPLETICAPGGGRMQCAGLLINWTAAHGDLSLGGAVGSTGH